MIRRGVWLALLLLFGLGLAGPGRAQPAPEPKQVRPGVAGVCTDRHHAVIDEAYAEAARRVRLALARLSAGEPPPEFRRWFGDAPAKPVETRLRLILAALERGRPHDTACEQPRACQGTVAAYAMPATGALGFCARFFRMPDAGLDSRFGTVIHELSHLVADTEDFAYGPRRAEALARENPGLAVRNADNLQYFVESLGR
ncbi:MAG: M35 family metallo-endopeptidase [Acetobacteraceae bacterium]|nr:M35 family metallo-endopeptidase [Acetobacteraceae bacterium]